MTELSDSDWKRLYQELGFLDEDRNPLSVPHVCPCRDKCWDATENKRLPDDDPSITGIYKPWVGPRYGDLRLVTLAINMNEFGGWNAMCDLVSLAKDELKTGRRRLRFGNAWNVYRGTLLFHRVGSYAAVYASSGGLLRLEETNDKFPVPAQVAQGFDFVAFTNHVKCSPRGQRSAPEPGMWEECGRYTVRRELRLLKPKDILVLGADNLYNVLAHGLDAPVGSQDCGAFRVATGKVDGEEVRIIGVPHPHAHGYDVKRVLADLKKKLHQNRAT